MDLRRTMMRTVLPSLVLFLGVLVLAQVGSLMSGREFRLGAYTSIQFVLNTNAAALASTLGILMAIVLLMVQLTAQRYSFNIIGMFVHDPRNVWIVALFIVTINVNLWLAATITEDFIPVPGTYAAIAGGTLCFAVLMPYLNYLFESLTPHRLLSALQSDAIRAVGRAAENRQVQAARQRAAERILHIGDVTRTSGALGDADVSRHSVWVLHGLYCDYLGYKRRLPREWFQVEDRFFRGRHALVVKEIEATGTWFERRIFEEFQSAFTSSFNRLEALNTTVALCLRLAGEKAIELDDDAALELAVKFFNTFLRAALNARDARAGYHLLYQYALLAETATELRPTIAQEIVDRIAYYGQTALGMGVLWMAIAAAQDLRTLAESSIRRQCAPATTLQVQSRLLRLIADAESRDALRGSPTMGLLHKAALALGAFHLAYGGRELALEIARALSGAGRAQLERLAADLAAVTEPAFWEITDRVVNFEYLEDEPRARLGDFIRLAAADQVSHNVRDNEQPE